MKVFSRRFSAGQLVSHIALWVLLLLTVYPFISMLFKSVKNFDQDTHNPWGITLPFYLENYSLAWETVRPFMMNTVFITAAATLGIVIFSSISGFILARFVFPLREAIFYIIISLMMIPGILSLIPLFILIRDLQLIDSSWGLIGPYIAGGIPFGIFLMRGFMEKLPGELFEAAYIDGASIFQSFMRIAVPLSRPIITTLVILNILNTWNDIILPSIVLTDDAKKTVAVGLLTFTSQFNEQVGPLFAGYIITSLPLLLFFIIASRQFISGMTSGALKL
ncbi:sugar ABC transporter permease [Paenibacillus baekrokdamisoli]|uniref:Sugar ABC transporter permease n=1 Tax=Paenibacillus baekrokdamisoli TaxID=1712516 RepID=A0A3G9J227_9BACL|nr:carbohydrate ABC transporter permease [Paenibacillus baekrokdamisoli]MBB3071352.1 ABC-type glycerol-3-phosphate transport system permease component [Paenibacillus baekrokdamisoli]BBH24612.1 sugar ABC transporter permease [Paenibacillus baekrokdamisoli]